jgi:hypothetical protein
MAVRGADAQLDALLGAEWSRCGYGLVGESLNLPNVLQERRSRGRQTDVSPNAIEEGNAAGSPRGT